MIKTEIMKTDRKVFIEINKLLGDLNISYKCSGRLYIIDMIGNMIDNDISYFNYRVTKDGYPSTAAHFKTSVSAVERNCRHAINSSYKNASDAWEKILGIHERPTVHEAICAIMVYYWTVINSAEE